MKLHDPQRPKISHRPAFISGWHVIPQLQLWPRESGNIELSLMLPVADQRFAGKWYTIVVCPKDLPDLVNAFDYDPEKFVLENFSLDVMRLKSERPVSKQTTSTVSTVSSDTSSVMELLK